EPVVAGIFQTMLLSMMAQIDAADCRCKCRRPWMRYPPWMLAQTVSLPLIVAG
ncbi:hypothetical protein ACLOJK_022808, partial [Asimina triloba]